jgi:hypothetical protein
MALPAWLQSIEDGRGTLPVVLVEGRDDVDLLGYFFTRRQPGWQRRFLIAAAETKRNVIAGVRDFHPEWVGIVDADEWSEAELQQATQRNPGIRALPRFCIESFFCDPVELWEYLSPRERERHDYRQFAQRIHLQVPDWAAHGAMWRVLRRLYRENRLPEGLESEPVTDENEIRRILSAWASHLAPEQVLGNYHLELQTAHGLPLETQIRSYLHGKRFFRSRVVNILDQQFSGSGLPYWFSKFRDAQVPPPGDLAPLLDWVLERMT